MTAYPQFKEGAIFSYDGACEFTRLCPATKIFDTSLSTVNDLGQRIFVLTGDVLDLPSINPGQPSTDADLQALLLATGFTPDRTPLISPLGAVPEPATWALMIAGFGLVGVALRRRERLANYRRHASGAGLAR